MKRCAVKLTCGRVGAKADWWYYPIEINVIEFDPIEQDKPDKAAVPCCRGCREEISRRFYNYDKPGI